MAGFGGAVKLTGESEYRKALNQINQSLRETSAEMKAVSSAYASNDKSQSAVSAKTEVLNKKLQDQNQKLTTLKAQYQAMSAQYTQQTAKHTALVNEYNKEKQKLDEIGKTLGTTSKEYQDQKAKVDGLAQEVRKSTQAQDANEKSMSRMRIAISEAQADINKTTRELDELGKEAEDSGESAEKAGEGFTVFKGILADLGSKAIMGAINGIKQLGGAMLNVGKQALASYADYEQLIGGVETLFKDSAPIVEEYANNAYKTAGMSANEYMETVTSFSASLISSLDGDTAKASEVANRAITDMSDNANKMGTDIGMIQNAYQGFAKQNYTMLDNLKLGYGGTKTEMERLIKDASEMTDVQKELGITVDANDMSFANVANAISVVQKNMGIMGTTAKEADSTIQGSTASMQSAWQNLLTGMADDNANFDQLVNNFTESLMTMLGNILPRVQTIITGMATTAGQLLQTVVPQLVQMIPPLLEQTLPLLVNAVQSIVQAVMDIMPTVMPIIAELIPQIVNTLISMLPQLVDAGIQLLLGLIDGLNKAMPQLVKMLPTIIKKIVDVLIKNLPMIIQTGLEVIVALIEGLTEAIPQLIGYVPKIVSSIVTVIINNLPMIIDSAVKIMVALINGLIQSLPQLMAMTPRIITTIASTLIKNLPQIIQGGVKIIASIITGIVQSLGNLATNAKKIGTTVINAVKEFPSKMLSVGKNIVKGIWEGITGSLSWIKSKISGWVGNVTSFIKKLFGIKSPSTLFRDEIGTNLALGIGEGFSDEMKHVASEMGDSIPTNFDLDTSVNGARYASGQIAGVDIVNAFKEALSQVKIVLDDEVAGEFVDKTVSRIIYA